MVAYLYKTFDYYQFSCSTGIITQHTANGHRCFYIIPGLFQALISRTQRKSLPFSVIRFRCNYLVASENNNFFDDLPKFLFRRSTNESNNHFPIVITELFPGIGFRFSFNYFDLNNSPFVYVINKLPDHIVRVIPNFPLLLIYPVGFD